MFFDWISSLRLKTLPLALSTILVGNILAYWQAHFNVHIFVLTLLTAILLQILSNLANDYGDAVKGTDDAYRTGPLRGVQLGLISINALKKSLFITTFLALLSGLSLLYCSISSLQELLIFIGLGAFSIIAAITYTVGKKPYGYFGLGDLSVFVFFGLVAVIGSFYLQTKQFNLAIIYPACALGLLCCGVLNMNNLRDYKTDKIHHKRTLVVFLGIRFACFYQLILVATAFILLTLFTVFFHFQASGFLFLLALPIAIFHLIQVFKNAQNPQIARQLILMVKMTLLCTLLFCLGFLI